MGISTQTQLNAKGFEEARNAVSGPYDQLRRMGAMTASDDVRRALDSLRVEEAAIGAEPSAKRVNRLVDEAFGKIESGLDGKRVLDSIRQLRRDAQAIRNAQKIGQAPSPEKIAEADAKMRIAGVLESMVEENIFDPKFKGEFRNARAALAKTYAYEEATDFNTGQIDPVAISRLTASDNALTGIIADIGAIAGNFPEIASAGAPSTLLQRAGSQITRSGISGTIGAGIGAVTPIGPIGGGVAGASAGELITGLQSRRIGTPEYQRRFAAPQDRRIFPQNELAPQPANALTPYIAPQTILEPQKGAFVTGAGPVPLRRSAESGAFVAPDVAPPAGPALTPRAQFVGPQSGPPALPAPSAEATMAGLRAEDARRASVSRAIGQEAEGRQAAAEAAARRPAGREVVLEIDPATGHMREASQGVRGATPETFQNFGANLQSAAEKVTAGRRFDLTAAEKVAWERTKVDLAEVSPGFKALSDKAIAEKMMDRQWVEAQVIKTREKIAAFDEIARRAKDAQARQKAIADRTRLQYDVLAQLEALEERLSGPRPTSAGGQGPKTRAAKAAAQRNALTPSSSNALND